MNNPTNGNGVWKWIAAVLLTALFTGALTTFTFWTGTVSRDEVLRLIKTEAPWLSDQKDIEHRIQHLEQLEKEKRERECKL